MNRNDVLRGLVPRKWLEREGVWVEPGLQINELTLKERQHLNVMKGGTRAGYSPVTRAEAERVGYRREEIDAWFGAAAGDQATDDAAEAARLLAAAIAKAPPPAIDRGNRRPRIRELTPDAGPGRPSVNEIEARLAGPPPENPFAVAARARAAAGPPARP